MKIVVRPAAAADVGNAYHWYRNKRPDLGTAFLAAVRAADARIIENPEAYPSFTGRLVESGSGGSHTPCYIACIPNVSSLSPACMVGEILRDRRDD